MKRLLLLPLLFLLAAACSRQSEARKAEPAVAASGGGDAARGKELVTQYGCVVCHAIPGVDNANGRLGPSLAGFSSRPAFSFGSVPNAPENVTKFVQNPASVNPRSTMPPTGVPPNDAPHIAAFLGTLR